jgi:general secretion pathway protein H
MTSFHWAPTDRKAAPERPPTSQAGCSDRRGSEDGFTLLEVVCVLAIVAMLVAVLMPAMPGGTSRPRLEAYSVEVATVLKTDRTAAIRRRTLVATDINAPARMIRSGATGRVLRIAGDVAIEAILPDRCNRRFASSTISFLPSGMSCGGVIRLSRRGIGYEIRVDWLTGGTEIVARNTL